ncbi:MAG: CehA/McbA family metallohydrolase [Pseudomonadales bacterium]|nr:CehA/McbA family metallohydrolase [Pseudomonadales bacterium]
MVVRNIFIPVLIVLTLSVSGQKPASRFVLGKLTDTVDKSTVLELHIVDRKTGKPLPARLNIQCSDGNHVDGSGRGLYADGRFFVDGRTSITCPAGRTSISVGSGPEYVPLMLEIDLTEGKHSVVEAQLEQWFSTAARGWYSGDNHVHAQHDSKAAVKTDLVYTALQARANGLDYVTEAGSHIAVDHDNDLSSDDFIFTAADEVRPGVFVGHLNTPGISEPLGKRWLAGIRKQPLPAQAITTKVAELGGVTIYTHPLMPRHQLHWMGAAELWSDMVHRRCADGIDVDNLSTELLLYAALNLGNKMAVSSSSDAALGRTKTLSPGGRRVYSHADRFTYERIIDGIRQGRTFATNGGPLFAFLTVDGKQLGETVSWQQRELVRANIEVHGLHRVDVAELIVNGAVVQSFRFNGSRLKTTVNIRVSEAPGWVLLRARDSDGNWVVTSPVYLDGSVDFQPPTFAGAAIFEINNTARGVQLRREFHAHAIVSVSPDQNLRTVIIQKDGKIWKSFSAGTPAQEYRLTPVTEFGDNYEASYVFVKDKKGRANHFQADWPVSQSGWYSLSGVTQDGESVATDAVYYDAGSTVSHEISSARVVGWRTELVLHGYGEDLPLAEIKLPFEGDHWWYPKNAYSMMTAVLDGYSYSEGPWGKSEGKRRFKAIKNRVQ